MNISIITVGKLKERYLKEAVEEYSTRLSKYCKLEIIEVPDEKAPENLSPAQELTVMQKEGQGILRHIKEDTYVIALVIQGRQLSSEGLADFINGLTSNLGMASQLASAQNDWGDWRALFKELGRINGVTPEDIQRVAKKYFTKNNRTVVCLNTVQS